MDLRNVSAPYPRPAAIIESNSRGLAPVSNANMADYFSAADLGAYRSYASARPVPAPSARARAAGFADSAEKGYDKHLIMVLVLAVLSAVLLGAGLIKSRRDQRRGVS